METIKWVLYINNSARSFIIQLFRNSFNRIYFDRKGFLMEDGHTWPNINKILMRYIYSKECSSKYQGLKTAPRRTAELEQFWQSWSIADCQGKLKKHRCKVRAKLLIVGDPSPQSFENIPLHCDPTCHVMLVSAAVETPEGSKTRRIQNSSWKIQLRSSKRGLG